MWLLFIGLSWLERRTCGLHWKIQAAGASKGHDARLDLKAGLVLGRRYRDGIWIPLGDVTAMIYQTGPKFLEFIWK